MLVGHTEGLPVELTRLSTTGLLRQMRAAADRAVERLALAPSGRGPCHARGNGQVILDLRHRWADGTTQLLFEPAPAIPTRTNWLWAELMQRSFGFDVLACPRCGDRLALIALIEGPKVIRRILGHLGLPADVPAARPARPPPLRIGRADTWHDDDISVP